MFRPPTLIATAVYLLLTSQASACLAPFSTRTASSIRLNYATQLNLAFSRMLDSIPALSPSESLWLDSELASDNQERRRRAFNSNEDARRNGRVVLDNLVSATNIITFALTATELGPPGQLEAGSWNTISDQLLNYNTINTLEQLLRNDLMDVEQYTSSTGLRVSCVLTAGRAAQIVDSFFTGQFQ